MSKSTDSPGTWGERHYIGRAQGNVVALIEAEAIQWDGSYETQGRIVTWSGGLVSGWFDGAYFLAVGEEEQRVDPGDWVVFSGGRYIACNPKRFHALYEEVPA